MRPLLLLLCAAGGMQAQTVREIYAKATADFEAGRVAESAAGFDRVAKLSPNDAPHLWQRGISLYYVGRFADCRAQFESHRTVNPNDVENAAWHYLCVARAETPAKAKAALLPVGPDPRSPMREIYRMFRGELTPDQVLAAAGSDPEALFYAHLYLGLYHEASGNAALARKHLAEAAQPRYSMGGYMHTVARVHVGLLKPK